MGLSVQLRSSLWALLPETKHPELTYLTMGSAVMGVQREAPGYGLGERQELRPLTAECWGFQALNLLVSIQKLIHQHVHKHP